MSDHSIYLYPAFSQLQCKTHSAGSHTPLTPKYLHPGIHLQRLNHRFLWFCCMSLVFHLKTGSSDCKTKRLCSVAKNNSQLQLYNELSQILLISFI